MPRREILECDQCHKTEDVECAVNWREWERHPIGLAHTFGESALRRERKVFCSDTCERAFFMPTVSVSSVQIAPIHDGPVTTTWAVSPDSGLPEHIRGH